MKETHLKGRSKRCGKYLHLLFFSLIFFIPLIASAYGSEMYNVNMTDKGFEPSVVNIQQGDSIEFKNSDIEARWSAADEHPTHETYGRFDSKNPVQPGESWIFTFEESVTWNFHDHLFPEYDGKITVVDSKSDTFEEFKNKKQSYLKKY